MSQTPRAVPLVTVDPFFSIWSASDQLHDDVTRHWTGRRNPMGAGLFIDGAYRKLMGEISPWSDRRSRGFEPAVAQTGLRITPTATEYSFADETVSVTLRFLSPLLLDRLDILSRPVSYMEYDIRVVDGREHDIMFQFDLSGECAANDPDASVIYERLPGSVRIGNAVQNVLGYSGDSVTIDWGYLHLAEPDALCITGQRRFTAEPETLALQPGVPLKLCREYPYLIVRKKALQGVITLGYDDVSPIRYLGNTLEDYYKQFDGSFEAMLARAVQEHPAVRALCEAFDASLLAEASRHGARFAELAALAYRQAIAAHKLVSDREGNILFLSKECHSNGCIGTLDVTYPSIPLFLRYNPELVKGMLRPILAYAQTDMWPYPFAPHDVGQYPLADGQVYGMGSFYTPEEKLARQMPVEECGNMLLCVAAVAKAEGSDAFARQNEALLRRWADYLVEFGYDPGNQLCTDDFAGHLAHNCNLSLKAILGIAAFGRIFGEERYLQTARAYAARWEREAAGEEATRLSFDRPDSWSLKYNIGWDKLLGFHLFSEDVFRREVAYYRKKMNRFGVPLDCRSDYTKLDWLVWTTVMTDDRTYFDAVMECIDRFIHESPSRVPLCDWYYTTNGWMAAFQNRTVVGGVFIPLLEEWAHDGL